MQFMNCNSCQRVVQINNTGICLGCQRGFTGLHAEDVYKPQSLQAEKTDITRTIDQLEARQIEIEAALAPEAPKPKRPKRRTK
jgi:predicted Fe-S protein YdhL (DUF1289 family)